MGIVTETLYDVFFFFLDIYSSTEPFGQTNLWQTTIEYNLGGITSGGTSSENYVHQWHNGYDSYTYNDGLGRVIQVRTRAENGAGAEYRANHTRYDEAGKIEFASLLYLDNGSAYHINEAALGSTTEYDPIGRPWRITPPPGDLDSPTGPTITEHRDGPEVWAAIVTDAEGNVTRQYFDARNNVIELVEVLTDPQNPTTEIHTCFEYDRLGRMTQLEDNQGNTILQYYDSLDRRIAIDDPDMGHWEYEYDDAGNLVRQTDARNNRVEMVYNEDEIGRITRKEVYNDSNDLTYAAAYSYDESDDPDYTVYKGLLYSIVDKEGTVQNGYDARGRILKSTRSLTINSAHYTTQTAYDDAGRVRVLTYPDNAAQISYDYDSVGHLIETRALNGAGTPNQVLYQATSFNEADQLEGANYGNGVKTRYLYYANSRRRERILTDYEGNPANPNPNDDLQNLRYTYDMAANIRSITDGSTFAGLGEADSTFSNILYDGLYRLRSLTYAAQAPTATGFEYDALGNIIYNGETSGSNYTYDPNKVHAVISAFGKTYQYDACGNMTHRDSASQNMFYDAENQLIRYDTDVSNSITFGYNVDGRRLWKKKNDTITGIWIGSLWEYKDEDGDGTGKVLCHVTVDDGLVCTFEPDPRPDSVFYYYHSDHLGSSSVMTNQNGDICKHYGYRAFGDERWDDSQYDDNMDVTNRYTGQMLDEDTGLYYYGARYYDPELARFTQPDPIIPDKVTVNSQALNRYTYCFNNPLIFSDPGGNNPTLTLAPISNQIFDWPWDTVTPFSAAPIFGGPTDAAVSTNASGASALSSSYTGSTPYSNSWNSFNMPPTYSDESAKSGYDSGTKHQALIDDWNEVLESIQRTPILTPDELASLRSSAYELRKAAYEDGGLGGNAASAAATFHQLPISGSILKLYEAGVGVDVLEMKLLEGDIRIIHGASGGFDLAFDAWSVYSIGNIGATPRNRISFEQRVSDAQKVYPKKAGIIEKHHTDPLYLGGAKNGERVRLDAAYHQMITNEFRSKWPYGMGRKPSTVEYQKIKYEVYTKYPIPQKSK